jgi:formylglycine-generating enzyme required for sulfatase activity
MCSPDGQGGNNERPEREVAVPGFYIGKYQVTQAQWEAVMGNNPSHFKGAGNLPVECVSWNDAKEFCKKLSQMTNNPYRLPSEAEWEYACRAGTTGDYAGNLDEMAWHDGNSNKKTHPVGEKLPNAFGLYDMHGNVWEWCEDVWHNDYKGAPSDGAAWLSGGDPSRRVLRGGSWNPNGWYCRSAYRYWYGAGVRNNDYGFRVVVAARTG